MKLYAKVMFTRRSPLTNCSFDIINIRARSNLLSGTKDVALFSCNYFFERFNPECFTESQRYVGVNVINANFTLPLRHIRELLDKSINYRDLPSGPITVWIRL
jgi:hypothetical protein